MNFRTIATASIVIYSILLTLSHLRLARNLEHTLKRRIQKGPAVEEERSMNQTGIILEQIDDHEMLLAPETVLHLPNMPGYKPLTILGFPFLHELDILHIKMQLLSSEVDYFVISEACYTQRGYLKPLFFNLSKHQSRFKEYSQKIWHIIDCKIPAATDEKLGWVQTVQVKINIGLALQALPMIHNDSIVIIGDSDEVPSPSSLTWLKSQNTGVGVTYEFASTMPHYIYGFQWRVRPNGYSTMTARGVLFERMFWISLINGDGAKFDQRLLPIPHEFAKGSWHCSYCISDEECIEKMKAANAVDGPLILGNYNWTTNTIHALKGCGVTPQGDQCERVPINVPVRNMYPTLVDMPECTSYHLPFRP